MEKIKKITALILCLVFITAVFTACSPSIRRVEIVIAGYGSVFLELDAKTAPKTVRNFISLAKSGFYDGLTFHRISPGFVIQGGDPNGDGTGNSGKTLKGEFAANGTRNSISHRRGVISMARGDGYDSASCQFFITLADASSLDGKYAAFGRVTEGMDVIDAIVDHISQTTTPIDSMGTLRTEDQPVITKISVLN